MPGGAAGRCQPIHQRSGASTTQSRTSCPGVAVAARSAGSPQAASRCPRITATSTASRGSRLQTWTFSQEPSPARAMTSAIRSASVAAVTCPNDRISDRAKTMSGAKSSAGSLPGASRNVTTPRRQAPTVTPGRTAGSRDFTSPSAPPWQETRRKSPRAEGGQPRDGERSMTQSCPGLKTGQGRATMGPLRGGERAKNQAGPKIRPGQKSGRAKNQAGPGAQGPGPAFLV